MAKVIEHLPRRPTTANEGTRESRVWQQTQPAETLRVLAREDLREIVLRLAQGERPGTAFEPISSKG